MDPSSSSTPSTPPPERPINPSSGFPEPYSRVRDTRPLWFRYAGLETTMDILSYRPGLKMVCFVLAASSFAGAVLYDKAEAAKTIREAKEEVKYLGQQKIKPNDLPRKVDVLAARIPEDTEEERGLVYFKKYVKPILVSAGIDYEYIPGQIPGSLARVLTARFKLQRLEAEAARASPSSTEQHHHLRPGQQGYVEQYNQEHALQGGTVIVGRSSLKEYMWALKEAWTTTLDLTRERKIAETDVEAVEDAELAEFVKQEGLFEPSEEDLNRAAAATATTTSSLSNPMLGSAFRDTYASIQQSSQQRDTSDPSLAQPEPPQQPQQEAELSPSGIPAQPPLLLLPFSHPLGSMVYWPQKLYAYFFGERARAAEGSSAALQLVYAHSRPFDAPERSQGLLSQEEMERHWLNADGKVQADADDWSPKSVGGDLDWENSSERTMTKHYRKLPEYTERNRKQYLTELESRIRAARAVARGDEKPAPGHATEEELLQERIRKEKRWRREMHGWRLDRQGSGISWADEMADKLRVFTSSNKEQE